MIRLGEVPIKLRSCRRLLRGTRSLRGATWTYPSIMINYHYNDHWCQYHIQNHHHKEKDKPASDCLVLMGGNHHTGKRSSQVTLLMIDSSSLGDAARGDHDDHWSTWWSRIIVMTMMMTMMIMDGGLHFIICIVLSTFYCPSCKYFKENKMCQIGIRERFKKKLKKKTNKC